MSRYCTVREVALVDVFIKRIYDDDEDDDDDGVSQKGHKNLTAGKWPVAMWAGLIVCRAASASSNAGLASSNFSSALALSIYSQKKNWQLFFSNV